VRRARPIRAGTRSQSRRAWRTPRPASPGRPALPSTPARQCAHRRGRGTRRGSAAFADRSFAEPAEEARVGPGVAGAIALLLDHEQQHVTVAVVVGLAHELPVAAGVALAPHLLAAAAPV